MTVRIQYEVNMDQQYLIMFYDSDFDRSRIYISGPEPVVVPRGERAPDSVKHAVTTLMLVELLDAILAEGIRPSSNAWSAGHVSDLKKHIEFAERVSFKLLESKNG